MSLINVNAIEPSTGTDITLGASGDTITIPSGATFTQSGTMNASAITAGTVATARLGSGTADATTFLRGDQTYAAAGSSFKLGTFTRDISTADGTQAVTGVGFQPTHLIFHANINNIAGGFSVGFDDGTTRRGSGIDGNTAYTFSDGSSTTDISILCRDVAGSTGASYEGSVTTLGADGFTVTWNKIGSPTGSLVVYYMAFA